MALKLETARPQFAPIEMVKQLYAISTLNREGVTSEAIKKLDEKLSKKLDQLIKLLQPPAFPGRMGLNIAFNFHDFTDLCYPSQLSNKSEEMAGKRNNDDYGNKNANTLGFMNKKLLCTCITLSGAFRIRKKRDIGYHLHEEAQN